MVFFAPDTLSVTVVCPFDILPTPSHRSKREREGQAADNVRNSLEAKNGFRPVRNDKRASVSLLGPRVSRKEGPEVWMARGLRALRTADNRSATGSAKPSHRG